MKAISMIVVATFATGLLVLLAFAAPDPMSATNSDSDAAETDSEIRAKLVVHEWGTFTSFSGSDGIKLEFRPLADNDLPRFVYNRDRLESYLLSKPSIPAVQRMETPVTYFYTPVERNVAVKVAFPQGLLTEFYPPAKAIIPRLELAGLDSGSKAPALKDSSLDWGLVHLIPRSALTPAVQDAELGRRLGQHLERTMVPDAERHLPYAAARDTDSAIVQVRNDRQSDSATGIPRADYFEKFLFYRGLGNFELPLMLTAHSSDGLTLENLGSVEIRSLFLVTVEGRRLSYEHVDCIAAGGKLSMRQSQTSATIGQLGDAVASALIAEGLYPKEAHAMVKTWSDSWFREEGTRLFYILPQTMTDRLLPLTVDPQPDEMVRVMVGRLEFMTPSDEQRTLELVRRSWRSRNSADSERKDDTRSSELSALFAMGRLAEPALARVCAVTDDVELKQEVALLVRELRTEYERNQEHH
jgi:hypothetical protein